MLCVARASCRGLASAQLGRRCLSSSALPLAGRRSAHATHTIARAPLLLQPRRHSREGAAHHWPVALNVPCCHVHNNSNKEREQQAEQQEVTGVRGAFKLIRQQGIGATVKLMWKRYGWVAIGTYWTLYLSMFGGGYLLFDSGLIPAVDTTPFFESVYNGIAWAVTKEGDLPPAQLTDTFYRLHYLVETNPRAKSIAMALAATELLEPVRYILVLAFTPAIARRLGRAPKKL